MFYWFAYFFVNLYGTIFSPRTVIGFDHVPTKGGFLIASNHLSILDPFLIGLCFRRRISYMAKDLLFRNWLLRFMLYRVEAFPVRRDSSDIGALRETLRRLKRGFPVVVFPEGTRRTKDNQGELQLGISFLAVKGNVPVVPVHISGSDKVLPKGAKVPRRNRVTVSFGKPQYFSKSQSYPEIMASIMKEIEALSI